MARIAVGIPSRCEADSIGRVAACADEGLRALGAGHGTFIVNVDGDSPDGTADAFLATPTRCPKVSIAVRDRPGGKGENVLAFLRWCDENAIEHAATLDADLTSIDGSWAPALLSPVLEARADFVAPSYRRSRFEGAITNHFAYPLLRSWLRSPLRQPIAGDFGLSARFLRSARRLPLDADVRRYGIDLFLSIHAAGAGFATAEVALGRKRHKRTFEKMPGMFLEVAAAGLRHLTRYPPVERPALPPDGAGAIDGDDAFPHRPEAEALEATTRPRARKRLPTYLRWTRLGGPRLETALDGAGVDADIWTRALAAAFAEARARPAAIPQIVSDLQPLFLLRTLAFWRICVGLAPEEVEAAIADEADRLDGRLQAAGGAGPSRASA